MEFSSLIGKLVLSPAGEYYGYVTQVYLGKNFSALSCLVCADGAEEEFIVPANAVKCLSDAVIAGRNRLKAPTGSPCPVGKVVYDEHGNFLGSANALTDGDDGVITILGAEGERTFPAKNIAVAETVIVYDKTPNVYKKTRAQRKIRAEKKPSDEIPPAAAETTPKSITPATEVMPEPIPVAEKTLPEPTPITEKTTSETITPIPAAAVPKPVTERTMIYRLNILGRVVKRTVVGLANQGETVTADMLRRARESHRLLELTSCVLTKK